MAEIAAMDCRRCGRTIEPDADVLARIGSRAAARRYDDCIWRCACGVAIERPRRPCTAPIHPRPEDNIPTQVGAGLGPILDGAINETARRGKRFRFAYQTSEDAVTWTVVRALQQQGKLGALLPPGEEPTGEPSILLWGAPAGGPDAGRIRDTLISVCDFLGEVPRRRSEPDVVLLWDGVLAVVEVKHRSGNDKKKADYPTTGRATSVGMISSRSATKRSAVWGSTSLCATGESAQSSGSASG